MCYSLLMATKRKFVPFSWDLHHKAAFIKVSQRTCYFDLFIPNPQWARDVKIRDHNCCQNCGRTHNLDAHHIFSQSWYPNLKYVLNNGVTLCRKCHNLAQNPTSINLQQFKSLATNIELVSTEILRDDFYEYHLGSCHRYDPVKEQWVNTLVQQLLVDCNSL